jgi:hypothetical protein
VAKALTEGKLKTQNDLSEALDPSMPTLTRAGWLVGFRNAVNRHNYPRGGMVSILKTIEVRKNDFRRWLQNQNLRRGPRSGTTGYQVADRKAFPEISRLMTEGEARSPYGAALILACKGKLVGGGTPETRARRVSALYRRGRA